MKYWLRRAWIHSLWLTLPLSAFYVYAASLAYKEYRHNEKAAGYAERITFSHYLGFTSEALIRKIKNKVFASPLPKGDVVKTLYISMAQADLNALNSDLPHSGKDYKAATIYTHGGRYSARLRYRGSNALHWRGPKKSLRIKLESLEQYQGISSFELLVPQRESIVESHLALILAKKLQLIAPLSELVWVNLNGQAVGLYLLQENLNEQTLINHQRMPGDIYSGEIAEADAYSGVDNQLFSHANFWQKLAHNSDYPAKHHEPMAWLIQLLNQEKLDYTALSKIIDYPSFARFYLFNVLIKSPNVDDQHNWRLYYDHSVGKFYPLVWDPEGWQSAAQLTPPFHRLDHLLLRDANFVAVIEREWDAIVHSDTLTNFLNFSAELTHALAKWVAADPDFIFDLQRREVADYRAASEELIAEIKQSVTSEHVFTDGIEHPGIAATSDKTPLPPVVWQGELAFKGLNHIYHPVSVLAGTTLRLSPGATLIFHQPVNFNGEPKNRISVLPEKVGDVFGALVFVDNAHGSRLNYCDISGGSYYKNALVNFSGMLSFAAVNDIEINHCRIENNNDSDDMVHVVYSELTIRDSQLLNAHADALDSELSRLYITNSEISNNGAEAIDMMGSRIYLAQSIIGFNKDNAISVGQNSFLHIEKTKITNNKIAVLAKDNSYVRIWDSELANNEKAFRAFQRNDRYPHGGEIYVYNSSTKTNGRFGDIEKRSHFYADNTLIPEGSYPGKKRIQINPYVTDESATSATRSLREQSAFLPYERRWPFSLLGAQE